jgi:hypothetical protein
MLAMMNALPDGRHGMFVANTVDVTGASLESLRPDCWSVKLSWPSASEALNSI